MKSTWLLTILLSSAVLTPGIIHAQAPSAKQTEWIGAVLKDIASVRVGMTRGKMRKVFGEEGGLSTVIQRTYVYRGCPYIKVDFQFEPHGRKIRDAEGRLRNSESDQDIITQMSKPYLEYAVVD